MFSLRTLFVVVAVAAFAAWALFAESPWVASAFVGLTVLLFVWAIVERRKPFWSTFAIVVGSLLFIQEAWPVLPTNRFIEMWAYKRDLDWHRYRIEQIPEHRRVKGVACHCIVALGIGLGAGLLHEWRTKKDGQ